MKKDKNPNNQMRSLKKVSLIQKISLKLNKLVTLQK